MSVLSAIPAFYACAAVSDLPCLSSSETHRVVSALLPSVGRVEENP